MRSIHLSHPSITFLPPASLVVTSRSNIERCYIGNVHCWVWEGASSVGEGAFLGGVSQNGSFVGGII